MVNFLRNRVTRVINGDEKPGLLFAPLFMCEKIYGAGVIFKNFLYETGALPTKKAPCKVICVGALTVGGAGKTPFVELLAKKLSTKKVGILSRGYGSRSGVKIHVVSDGTTLAPPPPVSADEPYMLARKLGGVPVVCAPKRIAGARELVEKFDVETIIMDDGFGHRKIERDLNILIVSAVRPFGNGRLLPAGPLREPVAEANRAEIIVISGGENVPDSEFKKTENFIRNFTAPDKYVIYAKGAITRFTNRDGKNQPTPQKPVFAFSGVAQPERFLESLNSLGVNTIEHLDFDDHHHYTASDIAQISSLAKSAGAKFLVTTEKDSARLANSLNDFGLTLLTAVYEVRITKEEDVLDKALASLYFQ
ncbi:Tetraacyldisaccharide 4'-kinase [hydrothermal vent metagenome]|uniref:tetraacyldisaccharide 4'-kinase n=1 Tax=hydrothermal vent metagenome TaxID=652676 RepID=A0A3B1CRD7_9ZZZZ